MSGGGKGESEKTRKVAQIRILPQNDSSLYAVIEEERKRCGEDEAVPKFKGRGKERGGGRRDLLGQVGKGGLRLEDLRSGKRWARILSVGGKRAGGGPCGPVAAAKGQGTKLGELGRAVRERKGE